MWQLNVLALTHNFLIHIVDRLLEILIAAYTLTGLSLLDSSVTVPCIFACTHKYRKTLFVCVYHDHLSQFEIQEPFPT